MRLYIQITDIDGNVLSTPSQFENAEVEVPLCDSRLARVSFSIYDPVCAHIQPLKRMIKVLYEDHLIFWGYIVNPVWNGADGTVTVNCHDPTIKLKHHFHRYGDFVVGTRLKGGYPMDAFGAQLLMASANPSEGQRARGVKRLGILNGLYRTELQGPRPEDLEERKSGDGYWRTVERGTNVWESLTNMMEAVEGFEMEFEPCDADHPPQWSHPVYQSNETQEKNWTPGIHASLHCYEQQGFDRTTSSENLRPIVWHFGFGNDNLENFEWAPDGDAVRNYAVVTYPGGERDENDPLKRALSHYEQGWLDIGIYGEWLSAGQRDSQEILKLKADYIVQAYGKPPDIITITPRIDRKGFPYVYRDYFGVGDRISLAARKGYMRVVADARIMKVTLKQEDANKNCRCEIECVPTTLPGDVSIGADTG